MLKSVSSLLHQGDNAILLLVILTAVVVLLVIACLVQMIQIAKVRRRIDSMTRGVNNASLEEMLVSCLDVVEKTDRRIDSVESAVGVLQAKLPRCISRVNMIRYDAFEDVGGQQSFTIALLDEIGDGVVITSVYSRLEIRVYAKSINKGRASHTLSQEEERVLREAAP